MTKKPKIITCCGKPLECPDFTNTCEVCGADYNWNGQRLVAREYWGEETGETYGDITRGGDPFDGDW